MAFTGLVLALLLAALDQTIVATALPTIAGELRGLEHLGWVVTAYLLAMTVTMPIYGKLGDTFGRAPLLVFAIVLFLIGSALCGVAQSMEQLIAFRALQGLGGGGLMVGAQAAIGDLVSPRERGRYQGVLSAVIGTATVVGPLLGGLLTDSLSWRWIFYLNIPVGALALTVILTALKLPRPATRRRLDYLGALTLTGAAGCLVLLTSWGGTTYAWDSPVILGLGGGLVVLVSAWLLAERRAEDPVLPLALFRNPTFGIAVVISFVVGVTMVGTVSYLPLFMQSVTGGSATDSGLLLVPMMGGIVFSGLTSGFLITRTGRYKYFPVTGTVLAAAGTYLLSTMDASTSRTTVSWYLVLLGLGIGLVMQVMVLAVQNSVASRHLGAATSSVTVFRTIGGCAGVAMIGAVFTNRLTTSLQDHLPPHTAARIGTELNADAIAALPPDVRHGVTIAVGDALPPIFGYVAPALAICFVLALTLREQPLRGNKTREGPAKP
ncbi:hypothetical protein GCM10027436_32620 [Actinophytocola sediminis]